ncbi:MAG: hypothetical protein ACO1O1_15765 [Adhaeribacter sp.]
MRDIKIYLHSNTTRLQTLVHVLAASAFFFKASHLPASAPYFLLWLYFYSGLGVLLGGAALFQALNRFKYPFLAAILNILAGVVLLVASLVKLGVSETLVKFTWPILMVYLLNLSAALLFILTGLFEDRIRKVPYMAFNRKQVYGRQSWFSTFRYPWKEIADVNFRQNRVKITTLQGEVFRYRVAKQSTGSIMYKSADYFCRQLLRTQAVTQKVPPHEARLR